MKALPKILIILVVAVFFLREGLQAGEKNQDSDKPNSQAWSFVSIPDFLNFDIE